MAGCGNFGRDFDRDRHGADDAAGANPGIFPHQKCAHSQYVLPHRHRRPLGGRHRPPAHLGLFALGSLIFAPEDLSNLWARASKIQPDLLIPIRRGTMTEAAQQSAKEKQQPQTFAAKAFAAQSATSGLAPYRLERRSPGPQDIQIEILYCGVCHSDLHLVRNEWQSVMPAVYPCVPGHEIVGRVVKTGSAVKKLKEGDIAAVGCLVDSCRVCSNCRAGDEQYCENGFTLTYNGEDTLLGGVTYGGCSD